VKERVDFVALVNEHAGAYIHLADMQHSERMVPESERATAARMVDNARMDCYKAENALLKAILGAVTGVAP
jgi:hypothetical protein